MKYFEIIYGHSSRSETIEVEVPDIRAAFHRLQGLADEYAEEYKWEYVGMFDSQYLEEQELLGFQEAMDQGYFSIKDLETGTVYEDLSYPFDIEDYT